MSASSLRLRRSATYLPLLLVPLFAALALWRPPAFEEHVENPLLDLRFRARNAIAPPAVPSDVVVVAVDELSIGRYGSWPWSRTLIAQLIEKVAAGGPRAIGVDVFFTEPESPAADRRLADTLAALRGRAAEAVDFQVRGETAFTGSVPPALAKNAVAQVVRTGLLAPLDAAGVLLPPEPIASASTFGHVSYLPDLNGKLHREYLYLRYGGEYFPSLALQTARIARGLPAGSLRIAGGRGIDFGGAVLPADAHGRCLVNYYGGERTFPHYSAGAMLSGETPPEILKGAVVFIGATGISTYDLVATPFAENLPAVEKNATVAANILSGTFLRDAPPSADLLFVLAAGAAVFLLCRGRRAAVSLVALLLLTALLVGVNLALFSLGVRLALAYPLLLVAAQGAATVSQQHLAEERSSRETRRMFSSYVTERVVDQLIADPRMARLGGERREVTTLFSDIRGFTAFSAQRDPEEVVATLNEFLGAMTEVVFRWEGTLDKFIGDTVMAFWGAPLPQPDHAERALRCALNMQARLDQLNAKWAAEGRATLEVGIGLNSGEVVVGNVGAEGKKMEYTVIGDHVNLASQVESLTKKFGCRILVTAYTVARLRPLLGGAGFGHLTVRALEEVAVKGRGESVLIYEVAPGEHGAAATFEERAAV